jgi:outer membrane cobalamin receptor
MNKRFYLLLSIICILNQAIASEPASVPAPGTIRGYVYDSIARQPLEYATVSLFRADNNELITGDVTDQNGYFRLTGIDFGKYRIDVSFIGYTSKQSSDFELNTQNPSVEIGQISLSPTRETLEGVEVVADRPTMTYRIDKKVINVSQQHTSASGTAVEVLENIPSITVSIEGDVSLRGSSSFTVLIDGKPSILDASDILNQIPASQIENIEIITNPSARFDPDGVAGIINIVMKKHRLQGMNGVVNLSAGNQNRYGGDFLVNYRKERMNYYIGADYNRRGMTGQSVSRNETYTEDTAFLYSNGDFLREGYSWDVRAGIDFNINPRNTLSLAYRIGHRERGSESDLKYEEWVSSDPLRNIYSSLEEGNRGGMSHTLSLDYQKDFDENDHKLLFQAILSKRDSEDFNLNLLYDADDEVVSGQRSLEAGPGSRYTFKLDYTLPLDEDKKFEAGYQSRISMSDETNDLSQYNTIEADFIRDDFYSKVVEYQNLIHSAYATFSGEMEKFGYQLGLRTEYTDRSINLIGEADEFLLERWDLYPTAHISYNLPADQQMMASYTRRLQRLRGWYLEPFYTWSDAYNVRIGNPNLDPEYIDSYELSYQKRFDKNTLSADLYYRVTHNKIERVRSIFEEQANVFLTTFSNVGKDYSLGTELMIGFDPTNWWHIDVMGNIYDYRQQGQLNGQDYSASSFNWNVRLHNDFKLAQSTRVQIRGMYNSPSVSAQGERSGYFVTNFAVKQDFLENALSLTLQVRDVFGSMAREYITFGENFYSFRSWDPNTPIVSLTASFRINNYRNDRRGRVQGSGMDEMGGDDEF